jgi:hypothetical protein
VPITWRDFEQQSWRLVQNAPVNISPEELEALLRTSSSRAYYGLYHRARLWLRHYRNFEPSEFSSAHVQVWKQFSGRALARIQNKGAILHQRRCVADYNILENYPRIAYDRMMIDCRLTHEMFDRLPQVP